MDDSSLLEWNAAARSMPGEPESGDVAVVSSFPKGALAAAVDGLGHGPEAARAAREAAEILQRSPGEPLDRLVRRCHEGLKRSRGVVMSLASFDARDDTMSWIGVGNVEGRFIRGTDLREAHDESLVLHAGIVGYRLPSLRSATLPIQKGDVLILATDGIRNDFSDPDDLSRPVGEIAERILREESKDTDDALVVVVRYLGGRL